MSQHREPELEETNPKCMFRKSDTTVWKRGSEAETTKFALWATRDGEDRVILLEATTGNKTVKNHCQREYL